MKNHFFKITMLLLTTGLILFTGCEDPEPEYAAPTISITSPTIPAEGLAAEVGTAVTFSIQVDAEAGLSTLTAGTTTVKTYTGTELTDLATYEYLPLEAGTMTLTFVVEDAQAQQTTLDVTLVVEEGIDLGYLLIDFAGASTASEEKTVVDWDVRTKYTFTVSGSHGSTATAEIPNTQAQLYFAQDNPDAEDAAKVLKVEKVVPEGFDNWGGWPHIIFGLGTVIDEATITALPTWDNDNSVTVAGTKVVQIDAYYDATVVDTFTWANLTALTDIWNADPSLGYKLDLALAAYDPMGIAENGHDGNMFIEYTAYIDEPNKWVTITFSEANVGRTGNFTSVAGDGPGAGEIDVVKIMPSPGYVPTDGNPLYLKNLRIVDVE